METRLKGFIKVAELEVSVELNGDDAFQVFWSGTAGGDGDFFFFKSIQVYESVSTGI